MSMFENYLEQLWEDLSSMSRAEVQEAQEEHNKKPTAGFDKYLDRAADLSHLPEQQQESYLEAEWDEFSEKEVNQVYQDRLGEFYRLKEDLEAELPVKGADKPLVKA